MTRQPMTAAEIVEALLDAQREVTRAYSIEGVDLPAIEAELRCARRDRIKAALVAVLEDYDAIVGYNGPWRKLEEACRGN